MNKTELDLILKNHSLHLHTSKAPFFVTSGEDGLPVGVAGGPGVADGPDGPSDGLRHGERVMTPSGLLAIEKIKVGDIVIDINLVNI